MAIYKKTSNQQEKVKKINKKKLIFFSQGYTY